VSALSELFAAVTGQAPPQFPTSAIPSTAFQTTTNVGDPVAQNLPRNIASYQRLMARAAPGFAQVDPSVVSAFNQMQAQRLVRGQAPSSLPDTAKLLSAGQNLQAVAPVPDRPTGITEIPGNIVKDAGQILTSIPKLPALLMKTGEQLPQAPQMLSKAIGDRSLEELSQVPGVNLIPGLYVGKNILTGNLQEILKHPLMNALDALPALEHPLLPASLRETLTPMRESGAVDMHLGRMFTPEEQVVSPSVAPEAQRLGRTVRYTNEALAKAAEDFGHPPGYVEPKVSPGELLMNYTPIGRYFDRARGALARTSTGQALASAVGDQSRNMSQAVANQDSLTADFLNPRSPNWQETTGDSQNYRTDAQLAEEKYARGEPLTMKEAGLRALPDVFDLREKYLNPSTAVENGGYSSERELVNRRMELSKRVQTDGVQSVLDDPTTTPWEQQMVSDYARVADKIGESFTAPHPFAPNDNGVYHFAKYKGDVYPIKQAQKLSGYQLRAEASNLAHDLGQAAPEELLSHAKPLADFLNARHVEQVPRLTGARGALLDSYMAKAQEAGMVDEAKAALVDAGLKDADMRARVMTAGQSPLTVEDIRSTYLKRRPGQLSVPVELRTFDRLMQSGQFKAAAREFKNVMETQTLYRNVPDATKALPYADVKQTLTDLQTGRDATSGADQLASLKTRNNRMYAEAERRTAPAPFFPKFQQMANARMGEFAQALTRAMDTDPAAADILTNQVKAGQFGMMDDLYHEALSKGVTKAELATSAGPVFPRALETTPLPPSIAELYSNFGAEARNSWQGLREQGFDPQFVHQVTDERALRGPGRILPRPLNPRQALARTLDFGTPSTDMGLALEHQAAEWLAKQGADNLIHRITHGDPDLGHTAFTVTHAELTQRLQPIAERIAARNGSTVAEETQKLIDRQFQKFEPNSLLNFPRSGHAPDTEGLYIDKSMMGTLEKLTKAPKVNMVLDPVMKVFRTSVLTLSPRWQIYNLLGGALMMTMSSGLSPLSHLGEVREVLRYLKDPESVARPEAMSKLSETMRLSLSQQERMFAEMNYAAGEDWARKINGVVGPERGGPLGHAIAGVGQKAGKLSDALVHANGIVDDAFRLMVYFDTYEKSAARLAPEMLRYTEEAGRSGGAIANRLEAETAVRKFMHSWDTMTPVERQTMRLIFPFYGFMSHMMRFAYNYAVDHPVRTAVTAAFARNELADWDSGLPERLRGMWILGDPHSPGQHTAINMAGWSPLQDVANMWTLSGLLSQANPIIATIAERFGIDPRTGQANLYPDSMYDPETGRLKLQSRSIAQSFLSNLIPQSQVLIGDKDTASLQKTDPQAYRRMQLSALGVPNLVRPVNLSLEAMKAEGARINAFQQGISQALQSPSSPSPYPTIRPLQNQILALQAQNPSPLQRYTPAGLADIQSGILSNVSR
jgi:hypothetical protein